MSAYSYQFAVPAFLLLLPVVLAAALLRGRAGTAPSVIFGAFQHLESLGGAARGRFGWIRDVLPWTAALLAVVALARPQLVRAYEEDQTKGIAICVAFDVSLSMAIEDFNIGGMKLNRLQTAKRVLKDFIEGRRGDRVGIVAFSGRPYLVSPLTLDHDWLEQSVDRIQFGLVEDGTAIGSAIAASARRLDKIQAESKVILLLTDGASNSGKLTPIDAAKLARTLGVKIYSIAVGTPGIHNIPIPDGSGSIMRGIKQEFDEETLQQVAKIGEGAFYHAENTAALEEIFKTIDTLEKSEMQKKKLIEAKDLFPPFVITALGFLMAGMIFQLASPE